jgi:predicted PurR-regulated permease PerM
VRREEANELRPVAGPLRISWSGVATIVTLLIVAYWLRFILLPFVAAGALAYVARPILQRLQRRFRFPRWLAALVPFLLLLGILSLVGYAIDRLLVPQVEEMLGDLKNTLRQFLLNVFHGHPIYLPGKTMTADEAAGKIVDRLDDLNSPDALIAAATSGFAAMMGIVLSIVLFGFLLFQGPRLAAGLLWLVPPRLRPQARSLAQQIDPMLGRYLRGVFIVVLFTTTVTWIITGPVFGVRHAFFLAIAVGLLELIPVVGPILSFVMFGLVAVQQTGYSEVIGFGIFAIGLRLMIDQLVGPLVLGRAAEIPAVVVIFAFLTGGALYGFLGVVLAIPAAAAIKIVLSNLYEGAPELLANSGEQ